MLSKILPYLRCPICSSLELHRDLHSLACKDCSACFPIKNGVLDMMRNEAEEVITPFQRIMQTPVVVSIYEKIWRRIGYYLASSRSFRSEMQTVLQFGNIPNRARALDLACGTGIFTRPFARQNGGLFIGLDLSWPMLSQAKRLIDKERMQNILLIRASAFSLPFIDSTFHHVNCCGALHLFDRPDAALKEIGRILEPGGSFSVQTTIRPNRSGGLAYFLEKFIRFGFFNEEELRTLLKVQDFSIVKSERHRISFTFLARHTPVCPP
jgi:ubiquinone/menaquinone biosynthesis C-methylase UbiE/uncharacterized protein YbaR (Trm112 family)